MGSVASGASVDRRKCLESMGTSYVRIKILLRKLCDQEKSVTMLSRNILSTKGTAPFLDVPLQVPLELTINPLNGQISFKIGTSTWCLVRHL